MGICESDKNTNNTINNNNNINKNIATSNNTNKQNNFTATKMKWKI